LTDDEKKNLIFWFTFLIVVTIAIFLCNAACNVRKEVLGNYKKELRKIHKERSEANLQRSVSNNYGNFTPVPVSNEIKEEIYQRYQKFYEIQRGPIALDRLAKYDVTIKKVATRYGVDSDLIYGIAAIESNGRAYKKNTTEPLTSKVGALGLMQIMPDHKANKPLCRMFGVRELDLSNTTHNLYAGGYIYNNYRGRMKNDTMLGLVAYNWGPNHKVLKSATGFDSVQSQIPKNVRSYAISVMAVTLMKKVKDKYGKILPYTGSGDCNIALTTCQRSNRTAEGIELCIEDFNTCWANGGSNAQKIQAIPLPGFD